NLVDEDVALLVNKYEKMLQGGKLRDGLKTFTAGFKSSTAAQRLQAVPKADRPQVDKNLQAALSAFNEQHTAYLASKAIFDKKALDKSKPGQLKRLNAMIDLHLQCVRLVKRLAELRVAFDSIMESKIKDVHDKIADLVSTEEKNRALSNEVQSLQFK